MITVLNINIGSVPISVGEIAKIIFAKSGDPTQVSIIWKIRLPRILMAALLGGALSLAGFLLQTFFSNPIAGPFVLGISSGAKMVVALTMIFFNRRIRHRIQLDADCRGLYRFAAVGWIYPAHVTGGSSTWRCCWWRAS